MTPLPARSLRTKMFASSAYRQSGAAPLPIPDSTRRGDIGKYWRNGPPADARGRIPYAVASGRKNIASLWPQVDDALMDDDTPSVRPSVADSARCNHGMASGSISVFDHHLTRRHKATRYFCEPSPGMVIRGAGTRKGDRFRQCFPTIVLDELDQEWKARPHRFVRYATTQTSSCAVNGPARVMTRSVGSWKSACGCQVNEEKSGVRKRTKCNFLGFRFHCKTGGNGERHRRPSLSEGGTTAEDDRAEMTPPIWGDSIRTSHGQRRPYTTGGCPTTGFVRRKRFKLGCHDAISVAGSGASLSDKGSATLLYRHPESQRLTAQSAATARIAEKSMGSQTAGDDASLPPRWFAGRLASLKALWHDLNPPQAQTSSRWHSDITIQSRMRDRTYGSVESTGSNLPCYSTPEADGRGVTRTGIICVCSMGISEMILPRLRV